MRVVKNLVRIMEDANRKSIYYYRVVKGIKMGIQAYGIEIERIDMEGEDIINIERDSIDSITPQRYKVYDLINILYDNEVSPIHLVDIIGEYVDSYISDFDKTLNCIATN
ncbi:DUF6514 family protein [Clostridium polynesiense]|uniref:DUF6514 family protein n=1 Tax=Clostridium polynesiense TaxID=1325933 RepID=UPI0005901352|nr:DUF6514 family protein [Clostridium polynesiense]